MSAHSGKRSATELNAMDGMEVSDSVEYGPESDSNYSIQFKNVRSNSMNAMERNHPEKLIFSRRTFRSRSKRTIGSTSALFSTTPSKPLDSHVSPGHVGTILQERSGRQKGKMEYAGKQEDMITSESFPVTRSTIMTPAKSKNHELPNMKGCCTDASQASGSSSVPVHPQNDVRPQYKASHSHLSFRSRTSTLMDNVQRSSFSNLRCTSISAILPSNSSIDRNYHGIDSERTQCHPGNSEIDIIESSARGFPISSRNSNLHGQSVADRLLEQENTRTVRLQPANSNRTAVSVRTRRANSRENRMSSEPRNESPLFQSEQNLDSQALMAESRQADSRGSRMTSELRDESPISLSEHILDSPVLLTESHQASSRESRMRSELSRDESPYSLSELILDQQLPTTEFPFGESVNTGSVLASIQGPNPRPSSTANSTSSHAYNNGLSRTIFSNNLMHGSHGYRYFAMREIAEVLLALERIERARQLLSLELSLESNLSGGRILHDQHRNMRVDIDNMTYEEILALEEQMGTVSTALTEEMLSKCLKKGFYNQISLEIHGRSYDDVKCSICQDEYCAGDEVATLACGHLYHVVCIQQWLRRKNWCPVCKVNAVSS